MWETERLWKTNPSIKQWNENADLNENEKTAPAHDRYPRVQSSCLSSRDALYWFKGVCDGGWTTKYTSICKIVESRVSGPWLGLKYDQVFITSTT